MANDTSKSQSILAEIQAAGVAYAENTVGAREKLMSLSRDLISTLELPCESLMRIGWAEPALATDCRIAVDLEIFSHLKRSGSAGLTAEELAAKSNANVTLVLRMMRHLVAMNIVGEKGKDTYYATPLAEALAEPKYRDGIIFNYDVAGTSFRYLPEYLKKTGYKLPTEATDGPFQAGHKTDLSLYSWLDQTPPYLQAFNSYMSAYRAGKPSWLDPGFYPVTERLINGFDPDYSEVFLVDVGGGKGHDLRELMDKYPEIPGKLVLQDRPSVIATVTSDAFEASPHDFFTAQPVKYARAYHLHSVLHNWNDDDCVKILRQLRPAMKPGYSRLLINDIVMPRRNPTWPATSMDQLMLVLNAVQERTEADWDKLFKQAGFRLVKVYSYELGQESLVEAEPDGEQP
ncbi:hypothetical protein ONZ43_g2554 [Nemania bipapillata]|uniref:Uncharacterized protein n=1 Tax=Nemania bipapillata TaxID=110536 RepID=A0ACC2J073_9PEZI|nr:hypothetical protein ONZ43_g2554 [Nemania bipapillata]